MSRAVMQQALEALVTCCAEEWRPINNFGMRQVYDEKKVNAAIAAIHAALTEPQTTHWEGCEAVHPECRKPDTDCHAQGVCQRSGYSIANTPRRPLTVFEIDAIAEHLDKTTIGWATHEFAAAIEKAHGIGEQHE